MRYSQPFHRKVAPGKISNQEIDGVLTPNDDEQSGINFPPRISNTIVDFLSDDESDGENGNDFKLEISVPVRKIISQMIENYIRDEKTCSELEFPSSLFCYERNFIRREAQKKNLRYRTSSRGALRFAVVDKFIDETSLRPKSNSNRKIFFSLNQREILTEIENFIETSPLNDDDRAILQAKIQKTPSSLNDWFYCALLREGNPLSLNFNGKSRVPDRRFLSRDHSTLRFTIDNPKIIENFLHLIENNKLLFVSGPAACGKSTRICQIIHDDFYDRQWPIRIVHSCNNNLSAYGLSSILSSFHQQIDCFTLDNISTTVESKSLITVTTHELLLHTLIAGDFLLKTVTHLIIDDVHKRSHDLDMLLAYLKDAHQKFRHLKLIFLQTSLQFDSLQKYFGNVPNLMVEPSSSNFNEIEEIFLDRILIEIENFDQQKLLLIETAGVELLNYWSSLAQNSSKGNSTLPIILESCRNINSLMESSSSNEEKFLNELIGRCFCFGFINDFQVLIDFIRKNPSKCNQQHPLTFVTAAMCAAMWSQKDQLEELLAIGEISVDLRAVNNFSLIDFARKYATTEIIDFLERKIRLEPLVFEQLLSLTDEIPNDCRSFPAIRRYLRSRSSKNVVDFQLIVSIVEHIYRNRTENILIFLPGISEIFIFTEFFSEFRKEKKLEMEFFAIYDSPSVWSRLSEAKSRFLIVCDGNCETGIPVGPDFCVIDTGIVVEKCSNSTSSKFSPKYNWINKTSGVERKSRVARNGIFFRTFPRSILNEKISEKLNSEMSRQAFLQNILQAKLFAWTSCSVAEFMLKLPFPPPFGTVRAGINQLKKVELLDKWEDLLELGVYSLALPIVDLPYAMMIVYGHLFKCLEPILILVSILTFHEPPEFSIFQNESMKNFREFFSTSNSDHFVLHKIYELWKNSTEKFRFAKQWNLKSFRMEQIDRFKTRLTSFLLNINFANYFTRNQNESSDFNENSSCWFLVEAILVRCLPENIIIYDEKWLTTRNEPVEIDRSSILNEFQFDSKEKILFAVCDDLSRTNRSNFLAKNVTIINPIVLLFFASQEQNFKLNHLELNFSEQILGQLKNKFSAVLKRKLQSLGQKNFPPEDFRSVDLLIKIFSKLR